MAVQGFRSYGGLVRVSLPGRNVALRRDTIRLCLPRLYRNAQPEISTGYLHPDMYTETDHWCDGTALNVVFEYLKELERGRGVTAVLQNRLDSEWRNSSHSKTEAEDLFCSLCKLFKRFGCSAEMFHTMESFFERHCFGIVQRTHHGWLRYIQGLDRIRTHNKPGMTSALSSLLQYKRNINSQDLRDLAEVHALSPQTLDNMYALIKEKKRRRVSSTLQILPKVPRDVIRIRGDSQKINGSHLDPDVLLDIAESAPEALDYHPNRILQRELYEDENDDDGYPLYSHNPPDCSDCDPASPLHPISSRSRPRMLPPIDDASFDHFNNEFGRRLHISGVPVM